MNMTKWNNLKLSRLLLLRAKKNHPLLLVKNQSKKKIFYNSCRMKPKSQMLSNKEQLKKELKTKIQKRDHN